MLGTATALRVRALARTVAAPKESPRGAPIAIQTEIVPRVVLDITSRATSAFYVVVEKQVLLDPHLRALAYRCQKKKTVALAMTTAIARVPLVVEETAVVQRVDPTVALIVTPTETVVAAEVIFISPVFLAFNATKARQA